MTPLFAAEAAAFWAKVDKSDVGGCWPWTGGLDRRGYGKRTRSKRSRMVDLPRAAHRCAWALVSGPIPNGMHVLHHCDNPPCVNPSHLHLGTNAQNRAEAIARGRMLVGEQLPWAKLSASVIPEIRRRANAGENQRALAAEYGVSQTRISAIKLRQSWRHVP